MLASSGQSALIVGDLRAFEETLDDATSVALVAEEALRDCNLSGLKHWVATQPTWSDLTFVVMTRRDGRPDGNPDEAYYADVLQNVTFIERPFHPTTFLSVVQTAWRARRRQYEARNRMEELREGERRLQTALLAGQLGTFELWVDGWRLEASDVCRAAFGRRAGEAFGYDEMIAFTHGEDRQRIDGALRRSLDTGEEYATEFRTHWSDRAEHWAELRGRAVRDRFGRITRLVGVCSDITDRKLSEARLRALNETLEQRVAERTAEVTLAHEKLLKEVAQHRATEQKLRQSQKLEAMGQLTGGVAHDFNNLLMAVLGNLDLLRKHLAGDARAVHLIDGALQGARRGASLTQRLLAFARRQDLHAEPVDLVALVAGMRELLARSVGTTVEVSFDLPERLPPALADSNQVELALINLALNARDAMPYGGTLTVRLEAHERVKPQDDLDAGRYVCLTVIDTGHGMDAETLSKAVDPFFSTKELGKGTGLGLSMIHGLAVQLNGALRLASRAGHGTTAELWLPVTDEQPVHAEAAAVPERESLGPATILVVDDDALIAMSTVGMLEDLGHVVIEAGSAEEAIRLLADNPSVGLVITDYSMPRMNGAQLAAEVQRMRPRLPVLLATGYAELPDGTGIDLPRLNKPYTQSQLAAEIAKVLR